MKEITLIADTQDVLEAFLDNGLHREYPIYCQFPHSDKHTREYRLSEARHIEFNDGFSCGNK
ncbi:hypothetical protein [Photobacterium sp.]|uniref:hypothetical protein n=1 Tax=Photobacterium sp. TaxID=660 RepID=UPI00299D9E49|nr:hypothetical protein [Photobacterium sp.]MDX1301552.1 hypothetical protein [Photobacterium sp.]